MTLITEASIATNIIAEIIFTIF